MVSANKIVKLVQNVGKYFGASPMYGPVSFGTSPACDAQVMMKNMKDEFSTENRCTHTALATKLTGLRIELPPNMCGHTSE